MKVRTNHHKRPILNGWQLTPKEREEFEYLDWSAIEDGNDSAQFVRAYGQVHDLGEFSRDYGITKGFGLPDALSRWDGYRSDSSFSALVVRYVKDDNDDDAVIVGLVTT